SVRLLAGIRDILVITGADDLPAFQRLLGDGSRFGVQIQYQVQLSPDGLAQAFTLGASFIGNDAVCLVLGDNLFYGQGFSAMLQHAVAHKNGATSFGYPSQEPRQDGVVACDASTRALATLEDGA